jgi:hypothetical protein
MGNVAGSSGTVGYIFHDAGKAIGDQEGEALHPGHVVQRNDVL